MKSFAGMSQFGATTKNPPWVRTSAQNIASTQQQQQQQQQQLQTQMLGQTMGTLGNPTMVQYQQPQQVFQTPMQMQQAGMAMTTMTAAMGTTGVAMPTALGTTQMFPQVATVSYPTPRALNPAAFQSTAVAATAVPPVPPATPNPSPKQRVFTGTVTKVHDNFGFVDEDVFFQTSCCVKGSNPGVGDRVLVEASYNPNMPFKWNATRIQVLPMTTTNSQRPPANLGKNFNSGPGNYNAVPPPESSGNSNFARNNQPKSRRRERSKERGRDTDEEETDRKKRREERVRDREEKEKRSPSVRRRSKSPRPRPRRSRIVPRYMVQIPKISLDLPEADVLELRRRYTNLYIPSDFFSTNIRWIDAFPPTSPFTLDRPCSFHVMNKEVDPVLENPTTLEPADADYLFSAKVMLMSMPSMDDVYRKCCQLAEEKDKDADERDFVHPTRLINFLVGLRGKNETMAVGGPWSPSLDGPNPERDPSVLIKTAIRTCRALTGINLSSCTQWYRFLEIYYRRGETTHKGRVVPARVETVVLFLPDVWSCVPTRLEWDGLHLNYKKQLERKLKADQDIANGATGDEKEEECTQEVKREPTHYSELDPKGMKVNELRQELEARTLSPKGLKSQLIARLTKAIKTEAEKAEEEKEDKKSSDPDPPPKAEVDTKDDEKKKKEEEEKKKQDERERIAREKKYTLPEVPHIIVHPSRTAKSGKFDCTVMSLSLLLDYRPEDTKEHSFEVSLFAELFNEMLMRDFGFNIFRALYIAPERPKEDEKDRKKVKDKKDEKDKKDDKEKKDDKDRKEDKKNGKKDEDKDEKKDDKHSKERKDDKTKTDEKNEDKDEEDDEEEEDEEDEDSKDGKRDKDRDEKDKKRDKDKDKKKKEKIKLYTDDKQLLLSFIYFDQSHCGYIFDKDIEELLYTLGLNLSRAQVRKLVQKVVTRDSLHYRKLTDKRIKSEDIKDTDKEKDRSKESEKEEKISDDADDMLSFGNRHLLPVFISLSDDGCSPSKRIRKSPVQDKDKDKENNKDREKNSLPEGFVMYKGALLDVQKLMDQLKRSEKARVDTENKMIAMKQDLGEVKESAKQSANTVKDLSVELREYKERLHDTDIELSKVKARSETYLLTLREVQEKVVPVLSSVPAFRNEIEDIQLCREDEKKTTETRANVKKEAPEVHEVNSSKADEQNSGEKETKTSKLSKADSEDCSSSSVVKHETNDKDNV